MASRMIQSMAVLLPQRIYCWQWRCIMMTSSNGNICRATGQLWRGALMFSLIYAQINGWVNNREAGELRRHLAHYDVILMRYFVRDCLWSVEDCYNTGHSFDAHHQLISWGTPFAPNWFRHGKIALGFCTGHGHALWRCLKQFGYRTVCHRQTKFWIKYIDITRRTR